MSQAEIEAGAVMVYDAEEVAVPSQATAVQSLMAQALDKGASAESIDALVSVYERLVDREANAALVRALTAFQEDVPPIRKRGTAKIATNSGSSYSFTYAELDDIAIAIRPHLKAHGLTYSWDSELNGSLLTVKCIVRHIDGAATEATFACPIDSPSKTSAAQKTGAALTYAKRQSLVAALGLTVTDQDLDGIDPGDTITTAQLETLRAAVMEREVDIDKLLAFVGVDSLDLVPAASYDMVYRMVVQKPRRAT